MIILDNLWAISGLTFSRVGSGGGVGGGVAQRARTQVHPTLGIHGGNSGVRL